MNIDYKFAIFTSFYNVGRYVDSTIKSVLDQTYKNWIWFVSDDGSSDDTKEKILSYAKLNPRIIYYKQDGKMEFYKNPNKFIPEECEYFAFMDSDDQLLPKCLEIYNKILNRYNDKDINFVSCEAFQNIANVENQSWTYPILLRGMTEEDKKIKTIENYGANIWGCLRMFKKNKDFAGFENLIEDFKTKPFYPEDAVYYAEYQKYGNFLTIKRNLYKKRMHPESLSTIENNTSLCNQTVEKAEQIKKENSLKGKSIRVWEDELFHDCNSFLNSNLNFELGNLKINFFTASKNDFTELYYLYSDCDLYVNRFKNEYEYVIVNSCDYEKDDFAILMETIAARDFKELSVYYCGEKNKITDEEITNIFNSIGGRLGVWNWCKNHSVTYFNFRTNLNLRVVND